MPQLMLRHAAWGARLTLPCHREHAGLPVESEDVAADAACSKLVRSQRWKYIRFEAGDARQFREWNRPGVRQVIPSDHQHAAGPKALEASSECLLDLGMRIETPADDAIAEHEIKYLDAKMAPHILHPVDEVPR